ncbi:hypothetical protein PoB_003025300 [Plakobranchus ocellatus]|uniref:Uncharacterized protein n=1 Tax=Plakobranchus ocellatus TaxID=259542 RepID=A0AAV4AAV9_9GAST|nr:hypothetical protein PoB_003025300 [Plakobranchus ocellatus]
MKERGGEEEITKTKRNEKKWERKREEDRERVSSQLPVGANSSFLHEEGYFDDTVDSESALKSARPLVADSTPASNA